MMTAMVITQRQAFIQKYDTITRVVKQG
jgi:hypothetical protein